MSQMIQVVRGSVGLGFLLLAFGPVSLHWPGSGDLRPATCDLLFKPPKDMP